MVLVGENILELIDINCRIWHKATKFKGITGVRRDKEDTDVKDRVECAMEVRRLNGKRSAVRWSIDEAFGTGANETKIDYKGEDDA